MSMSMTVYTGFYIKAPHPVIFGGVKVKACPSHGEMDVAFCPKCGTRIEERLVNIERQASIEEIIYEHDDSLVDVLSPDDCDFIRENVVYLEWDTINGEAGHDYFIVGDNYVTNTEGGAEDGCVVDVDIDNIARKPDQEVVDRIVKIMGYETYQMQFGTLVSVTY